MTLVFGPNWLDWDVDVKEITKLEAKKTGGVGFTEGNQNKLDGLLGVRTLRGEGAIFLLQFNTLNVSAAVWRAVNRFNSAPEASQLLNDCFDARQIVRIMQGTHQPENISTGGYMLHFDAKSPRAGAKTFHLYVGQRPSGALTITSIAFKPNIGSPVNALPDIAEA